MRIEASLALFATTLASETAEITNAAPTGSAGEVPILSEEQAFLESTLRDEDILAVGGDLAAASEKRTEQQKKFSEWTAAQRAALQDVPAEALARPAAAGEARALQSTGDGYTAICNPFLGTCTCNTGDYWQLGWCQKCTTGCAECTSERNCTSCKGNMVLDEYNSCKCESGAYDTPNETCLTECAAGYYFNYGTQACVQCSANCTDCLDADTCYAC